MLRRLALWFGAVMLLVIGLYVGLMAYLYFTGTGTRIILYASA